MIGFFDSGFGGLTVLKNVVQELPEYNYLYLGDNARVPYGGRSPETVHEYTIQAVDFLIKRGCLLVIIACNTVSSGALRRIQQEFLPGIYPDRKVLGVIRPSAEEIADRRCRKVGILATEGVVESKIYTSEIEKLDPSIQIFYQACPLLVPIIEAGKQDERHSDTIVSEYLDRLFAQDGEIDAILLSCTHYPILYETFRRHTPSHVKIISQGPVIANKLRDYLARHPEVEKRLSREGIREFLSTDSPERFNRLASVFYGESVRSTSVTLGVLG
ncbi:MAG: glutamate racemase [Deltaproteobacteria bacterium]|nr:glutamate racemase [Deltaproteobacteria bacterium]